MALNDLDERLKAIGKKCPTLKMSYLNMAVFLNCSDDSIARHVRKLKERGELPPAFMAVRLPESKQSHAAVPWQAMVLKKFKAALGGFAPGASIKISQVKKMLKQIELEEKP